MNLILVGNRVTLDSGTLDSARVALDSARVTLDSAKSSREWGEAEV